MVDENVARDWQEPNLYFPLGGMLQDSLIRVYSDSTELLYI